MCMMQVPLDGFGNFSTARPRRAAGAAGRRLLQPDLKAEGEPASLLHEGQGLSRGRGSPPEESLLSPPILSSPPTPAPAPPAPPKRRGRPPGSTKSSDASAAPALKKASVADSATAAPQLKRWRHSEEDEGAIVFPAPITAPSLPLSRGAAARRTNSSKLVFFGNSDDDQR
jgi:hypothetical protein